MPTPPRRPGRPPLADDDPSVSVHLRLPSRQYDQVYQRAQQARLSVPELVRRRMSSDDDDDDDR